MVLRLISCSELIKDISSNQELESDATSMDCIMLRVRRRAVSVVYFAIQLAIFVFVFNLFRSGCDNHDYADSRQFYKALARFNRDPSFPIGKEGVDTYISYTVARLDLKPLAGKPKFKYGVLDPVYNNVSFTYKKNPNDRCARDGQQGGKSIFIVVISAPGNYEKRDVIRRTWGSHVVANNQSALVNYAFLIGTSGDQDVQQKVEQEADTQGDIILLDRTVDRYRNLTQKSIAMLHWSSIYCRQFDFHMKCDDDVYVNYWVLIKVIASLDTKAEVIYGSRSLKDSLKFDQPIRDPDHRWSVSHEQWPWTTYPIYVGGPMYWMNTPTVDALLDAARVIPYFPFEDVYVTCLCSSKASVKLLATEKILVGSSDGIKITDPDACMVSSYITWLTKSTDDMRKKHEPTDNYFRLKTTSCVTANETRSANGTDGGISRDFTFTPIF